MLRSIFSALDRSKDGKLEFRELSAAFELFGFGMMDQDELQRKFNEVDEDNSGYVEFTEVRAHELRKASLPPPWY